MGPVLLKQLGCDVTASGGGAAHEHHGQTCLLYTSILLPLSGVMGHMANDLKAQLRADDTNA